jgi:hypothetical protein
VSDAYNNVRIFQQADRRWTLAWEDAGGVTQQREDYANPEEAAKDRDDMLEYARKGSEADAQP